MRVGGGTIQQFILRLQFQLWLPLAAWLPSAPYRPTFDPGRRGGIPLPPGPCRQGGRWSGFGILSVQGGPLSTTELGSNSTGIRQWCSHGRYAADSSSAMVYKGSLATCARCADSATMPRCRKHMLHRCRIRGRSYDGCTHSHGI